MIWWSILKRTFNVCVSYRSALAGCVGLKNVFNVFSWNVLLFFSYMQSYESYCALAGWLYCRTFENKRERRMYVWSLGVHPSSTCTEFYNREVASDQMLGWQDCSKTINLPLTPCKWSCLLTFLPATLLFWVGTQEGLFWVALLGLSTLPCTLLLDLLRDE